mgnify:CR=1 FL=1
MIVAFTIALISGLAQAPSAPEGMVSYVFEFTDVAKDPLYALADPDKITKSRFTVYKEEPWNRRIVPVQIKLHDLSNAEKEVGYTTRMKAAWKANGGVQLTDDPNSPWVLKEELALMKKAEILAQPVSISDSQAVQVAPEVELVTPDTVQLGALEQYWRHGLIGFIALILIILVIRWGFFSEVWLGVD